MPGAAKGALVALHPSTGEELDWWEIVATHVYDSTIVLVGLVMQP